MKSLDLNQDKNGKFNNSSGNSLTILDVVSQIKAFLEEDQSCSYKLTIGTDSEIKNEAKKGKHLNLITAIVIYRKGYGGKYFWTKKQIKPSNTLREKIYNEVLLSIDTAKHLVPELKTKLNGMSSKYDLEIHIDVGEKGETRNMIKEVVGMVAGNGFTAKTKPDSYAASCVADKHV